jgi:hypothetical protein
MTPLLTIKEAAAALRVSQQWLKYWLVDNPVDAAGVPFYVRMGSRLKFEPKDIERILDHLRLLEATRLGPSIKAKARLAGLLSQVGYDHLVAVREAAERRKEAAKVPMSPHQKLLGKLAVENVLGPRQKRLPKRRVTLSRAKPPAKT